MKKWLTPGLCFVITMLTISCTQEDNKQEAKVSEELVVSSYEGVEVYALDTITSFITWTGRKPIGKHHGTTRIGKGSIAVKDGEIVGGEIVIDIHAMEVLNLEGVNKQKFMSQLKSADFFDVAVYPTAIFRIVAVEMYEHTHETSTDSAVASSATHLITGNLTMKDKTRSITFPAQIKLKNNVLTTKADFLLDLTLWGVLEAYEKRKRLLDKLRNLIKDVIIHDKVEINLFIAASMQEKTMRESSLK
ncbi:MAG: YceI family protein [Cytophagales bacterium]|nr:YceI family protein [Cytophagales bacterium]